MLRLRLLGSPELHTSDGTLKLPLERISWLLTILVAKGDWVRREEIIALLWAEDIEPLGVQQRLRQLLYRTKQLGLGAGIESDSGRLRWTGTSDLFDFKVGLQKGLELEALQIGSGTLLEGVVPNDSEFGAWLTLEREFMAAQRREVTLRLAKQGSPLEGLDLLENLVALDETVLLEIIRLAGLVGDVSRAKKMFARFERELLEFGEVPSEALVLALGQLKETRVVQKIAAQFFLPQALTPLLGRETELNLLRSWLLENNLVTVMGIGGIGKTSLALEAVRGLVTNTDVVFVPLVGLQANTSFAPSIMAALGLGFMSGNALEDDLFEALSRRTNRLLLVLDNVEHCIETAREFALRFSSIGHLRLLFTSRTRLGVRAEHVLELGGLSLPKSGVELMQTGAGLAFVAAVRRQRAWQPNQTELDTAARVCVLLAGAPLALELAAAWMRAMSIADIEYEIIQSLDFLEGGLSDLPPRQAGLRATFSYSWQLLSATEQRSLRRLSIFRGGFTKEAAMAITGIGNRDILSLSSKSLLRSSAGRFSLHELIREYSAEKLRLVENDWAEVAHAHAAYYLGFVEQNNHKLRTFEQMLLLVLEAELDNLRTALTWAQAGNDQNFLMKLATALSGFWIRSGLLREGIAWLKASLQDNPAPVSHLLCNAYMSLAQLQQMLGDLHTSVQSVQKAIETATELNDLDLLASARNIWARSLNRLGHFQEMHRVCEETVYLAQNKFTRAIAMSWLGQAEMMIGGDLAKASRLLEESLATLRPTASVSGIALILSTLGSVAAERQDFASARACQTEALEIAKKIGNRFGQILHFTNLGRIEMKAGDLGTAQQLFLEGLEICKDLATNRDASYIQIQLGHIAVELGEFSKAKDYYLKALRLARELYDQRLQLEILAGFAQVSFGKQQLLIATEYLALALHHPQSNYEIKSVLSKAQTGLQQQLSQTDFERASTRGLERGLETTMLLLQSAKPLELMV
jgi:predicted ATPase/DNA-binding SARP family transcriptional activator